MKGRQFTNVKRANRAFVFSVYSVLTGVLTKPPAQESTKNSEPLTIPCIHTMPVKESNIFDHMQWVSCKLLERKGVSVS